MTLEVKQLYFDYPQHRFLQPTQALLDNITFQQSAKSILHLKGSNGSGKTTLLKVLAGLLRPQNGQILLEGQNIWTNIADYQSQVCYLGHTNGVHPGLTLEEHCRFDFPRCNSNFNFTKALQDFSLDGFQNQPISLLSAGQKRRVALLKLVFSSCKIWLLDEPLVALDKKGELLLMTLLQEHLHKGGQIIYSSHQTLAHALSNHQEYVLC